MTALPTITGAGPVLIEYSDGSSGTFELDDYVLRAAIAHGGGTLESDRDFELVPAAGGASSSEDEKSVDFAWITWPDDLKITYEGRAMGVEEATERFTAFLIKAIRSSLSAT